MFDDWIVTGQKVWTSGARNADYGMLIARTDWDAAKHRGLTFFFFPMKQAGVEVRPIRQITGERHFNEVFITEGRVPEANRIGGLNDGWRVLQTALAYERAFMGEADRSPRRAAQGPESGEPLSTIWGSGTDLVELARAVGRSEEPVVRQAVAEVYSSLAVNRWNARRATAALKQGSSSPVRSLGKLAMSRIVHTSPRVQALLLGSEAMLVGDEHPRGEATNYQALNAFFTSIGGGTDQIQLNIIGERILGLPKEPETDRDIPFREVRQSTPR